MMTLIHSLDEVGEVEELYEPAGPGGGVVRGAAKSALSVWDSTNGLIWSF
jgi:hypothetical protein